MGMAVLCGCGDKSLGVPPGSILAAESLDALMYKTEVYAIYDKGRYVVRSDVRGASWLKPPRGNLTPLADTPCAQVARARLHPDGSSNGTGSGSGCGNSASNAAPVIAVVTATAGTVEVVGGLSNGIGIMQGLLFPIGGLGVKPGPLYQYFLKSLDCMLTNLDKIGSGLGVVAGVIMNNESKYDSAISNAASAYLAGTISAAEFLAELVILLPDGELLALIAGAGITLGGIYTALKCASMTNSA